MSKLFDLSGKRAVITGASSGLGKQMAHALAEHGADVALLARRTDKLEAVVAEIKAKNQVKAIAVTCDVANLDQIKSATDQVKESLGGVDILVNNAGVGGVGEAKDMDLATWQQVIDVNLTGVFLCAQQFGQLMIDQKYGKIVSTASIFGHEANQAFPVVAYHATKAAVINLTRALAAEWAKYNITVNAIGPGFFESEMTENIKNNPEANQFIINSNPMHRWGQAGELDGVLLLLTSDASSFITGQTIFVDGGWTAV